VNFCALEFATHEVLSDREAMSRAVAQDGLALQFASEDLRGDRSIVLRAVMQNFRAFQFATQELRADRDFVLQAMEIDRSVLMFAAKELREDRAVWLYGGKEPARGSPSIGDAELRPLDAARCCGVHVSLDEGLLLWLESEPVHEPLGGGGGGGGATYAGDGQGISAPLFVPPERQGGAENDGG